MKALLVKFNSLNNIDIICEEEVMCDETALEVIKFRHGLNSLKKISETDNSVKMMLFLRSNNINCMFCDDKDFRRTVSSLQVVLGHNRDCKIEEYFVLCTNVSIKARLERVIDNLKDNKINYNFYLREYVDVYDYDNREQALKSLLEHINLVDDKAFESMIEDFVVEVKHSKAATAEKNNSFIELCRQIKDKIRR